MENHRSVSVEVYEASDLPGTWIAHVLDIDVVTQGTSPGNAFDMAREAAELVLADDAAASQSPREKADKAAWDSFNRTRSGEYLYGNDKRLPLMDRPGAFSPGTRFASEVYLFIPECYEGFHCLQGVDGDAPAS